VRAHFEDVLVRLEPIPDERVVDAHLAELILDDGNPLSVVGREDMIQQRRLPRAQEASQHRHRHASVGRGRGSHG